MNPFYNNFFGFLDPLVPNAFKKPPTIYAILNSIVNGAKEPDDYTKIKNLAKEGRSTIFNFEYPLSEKVSKEKFEIMILNHYLERRIGFETVTSFQIHLDNKLNEIMPIYNKLFDSLDGWDLLNDGEKVVREGNDDKTSKSSQNSNSNSAMESSNNLLNNSTSTNNSTSDRRRSTLPQNNIEDVKNGSYLTEYNFDTNENIANDQSSSKGTSTSNSNSTNDLSTNATDKTVYTETITRTPADKLAIYKEFQNSINSIYKMIFSELNCLFYSLV